MGHLANSLYYTPTPGIGLENLEPVNKKGERRKRCTATTTARGAAQAEATQPRPTRHGGTWHSHTREDKDRAA